MNHCAARLAPLVLAFAAGCSDDAPAGGNSGGVPSGTGGAPSGGGGASAGGATTAGAGGVSSGGGTGITGGSAGSGGAPGAGGSLGSGGSGNGGSARPDGGMATRPIASPPTYRGTVNNAGGCARDYQTRGFEPDDAAGTKHPLFLYFTGTNFVSDEASFRAQTKHAADAVTEAMARRGMVALWVEYDNGAIAWLSDHVAQLGCLFGKENAQSALAAGCALPNVDCDLGIATWGHSQGGYLAHAAHNADSRVRAAWLSGYGGDAPATLAKERMLLVNGENDPSGNLATMNQITGLTTAECPDDGRSECFRPDGSGWIIVRAKDCVNSTADHCWFDKKTCTDSVVTLEPNWIDRASNKPFALEASADWVAATVVRP